MDIKYKRAFSEIYEIIECIPEDLKNKIYPKFYSMIEENRDKDYSVQIGTEPLEWKLLPETEIILGVMYRNFWCSKELKEKLFRLDSEKIYSAREGRTYSKNVIINDIFPKNDESKNVKNEIVVIQEKWYQKIFNKIKNLFKKKES